MFRKVYDRKRRYPSGVFQCLRLPYSVQGFAAALNNCAFVSTLDLDDDRVHPFTFLMDASMLGVGVGFDTKGAGSFTIPGTNETAPRHRSALKGLTVPAVVNFRFGGRVRRMSSLMMMHRALLCNVATFSNHHMSRKSFATFVSYYLLCGYWGVMLSGTVSHAISKWYPTNKVFVGCTTAHMPRFPNVSQPLGIPHLDIIGHRLMPNTRQGVGQR